MAPRPLSPALRAVALGCLSLLCGSTLRAQTKPASAPTAAEVLQRMIADLHITLPSDTVDTIKAGDPNTRVTGIATTFLPTFAVLQAAVAHGDNLIITHEPSFYNHRDETAFLANDPVFQQKLAYINQHHLVLFRLHDGWHLRRPDGIIEGWVKQAGWERFRNPGDLPTFTLPPTTLQALGQSLQKTFGARILRVIGDPNLPVTHVAFLPGAGGEEPQIAALERPDVDVLVTGESSEWETVEYARDAALQGRHKALILLGHDTSEEIGMQTCATWLRSLFPAIPVHFIPAGEPYWLPAAPPSGSATAR